MHQSPHHTLLVFYWMIAVKIQILVHMSLFSEHSGLNGVMFLYYTPHSRNVSALSLFSHPPHPPLTNCDVTCLYSPLLPPSGDIREQDPSRIESLKVTPTIYPEI